ncbi:DBR1-domain-containing protein [Ramaria rubella]|nr:DBR1-domain-containing protein [Ramaria rubella]
MSHLVTRFATRSNYESCCHGELDNIYHHIASLERQNNYKVDLLLICGDFQAIRNHADLQCMAVPQKYKHLGGFHKYYLGQAKAPILTIVIGGNHEASNYMWELYHGGWLASNIYFLGFSGCVQVNGIRIAGASGIYKSNHYAMGHHEKVPYDNSTIRSIYHIRQFDVFKLAQLSPPDIFLSHDWPNTIEQHGDLETLLRRKPFFRQEAQTGTLGSPPLLDLLKKIKPHWWFSAHLHTKFEALYRHDGSTAKPQVKPSYNPDEIIIEDEDGGDSKPAVAVENPDEIKIDDDEGFDVEPTIDSNTSDVQKSSPGVRPVPGNSGRETRFLALDKCLPRRDFLQVVDVPILSSQTINPGHPRLTFDPEWLAITRALHPFFSTTQTQVALPKAEDARTLVNTELEWVRQNIAGDGLKEVSEIQTFWRTAPGPSQEQNRQLSWYTNPQTEALTQLLQIPNKVNPVPPGMVPPMVQGAESEITEDSEAQIAHEEGITMPESDLGVYMGNNEAAGSSEDAQVTYPEEAMSGGWSPSRIVE